ncbi:MAG: flagellar biosynthetic protein FliR [Agathobacter sp.]|nr:flagellar biosynthetic protein FliR [Agathobacter sp.]
MVDVTFSLDNFEYLLLILVRISSFVYTAPVFGHSAVPGRIKIGLSFFVSLLLYNVVPHPQLDYVGVVGYAVCVLQEGITGLIIGFAANICNSILLFAGNIIDMDIGLSMATEFNPDMATESTISGDFYYYIVLLLLMISDMHTYVLRAACDSFYVIPIGGTVFHWDGLLAAMTKYMLDLCIIGFRIFLPVFACIMVLNCILGIMAKVAPQMNMFAVGVQLKLLVGLAAIFLTIFLMPNIANFIFREIKTMVGMVIESMH